MLPGLVTAAWAQEGPPLVWTPVVEVRGRTSVDSSAAFTRTIEQLARVGLEASRGAVSARVSIQETRGWSADGDTFAVTGSFAPEIAEGWARVSGDLTPNLGTRLTIGRQAIGIDDGRLLGRRDWEFEGQFLDAVRLEVTAAPFSFEYVNARRFVLGEGDPLGFGVNVVRLGAGADGPITRWKLDALSVVDARDTDLTTATLGMFSRFDTGRWRSRGEVYVQGNAEGAATLAAIEAGWVFGPDEGWRLSGGVDATSGDSPGSAEGAAFQPVLGDTHDLHGQLDLLVAPGATDGQGLLDLDLAVETRPTHALRLGAAVHRFSSAVDGDVFGAEADVHGAWRFSPFGELGAGYGHFFPVGGFRDRAVDGGYIELDVAF